MSQHLSPLQTDYETAIEALSFVATVHKQFPGTAEPAQWLEERLGKKVEELSQLLTPAECEAVLDQIRHRAGPQSPQCESVI